MKPDEIATELRQLLQGAATDLTVQTISKDLRLKSFSQIKRVVRSLPTEFGIYNYQGTQYVKYYAAGKPPDGDARGQSNSDSSSDGLYCSTCNQSFKSAANMEAHLNSARHKVTLLAQQLQSSGSFHANLQGLRVSEFGEVPGLKLGESHLLSLLVENVGTITHQLKAVYQVRSLPDVRVLTEFGAYGISLPPGQQLTVELEVKPRNYGIMCTLVMLDFGFVIARELRAECDPFGGDPDLPNISARAPYTKRKLRNLLPNKPPDFVPGEKEKRPKMPWQRPPRQHAVPAKLRQLLVRGSSAELQAELDKFKQAPTDIKQHLDKLHFLLHLEELQQEVDVRTYDMMSVELLPSGRYLALRVPGLAEARPSVLRGDALYVSRADRSDGSKEWQGFVHMVRQEEVLLRFNAAFHQTATRVRNLRFNVRFSIKRTSFVFMHEALDVARGGAVAGLRQELLVPPPEARSVPACTPQLIPSWCNASVGSNPEQAEAVRSIVAGTSGRLPFIIWGPPGTGKTSTLVEAAAQVLRLLPDSHLLLVAPSNLAADLLALRLHQSGRPKSEMLRVCAFARPKEDLLEGLMDMTCWDDATAAFQLPDLQRVTASRVRVVVVTALMAAKLHALGVPAGHFSHIMVDEAGHAEEPLALCALAGLAGPHTSVVLAGDPKQLGPVIHSKTAREAGLGISLLERLTGLPPYAATVDAGPGQDGSSSSSPAAGFIVKLVRNYRSHPKLLQLPSRLFYQGELQACASPEITHTLLHWDTLPNKEFPMLFHSVVGKDEREEQSPSWFNVQEAKMVLHYVQELMSLRRNRVTATQIGVVTPYRRQVQRIRTLLNAKGYAGVQVGSVEQLQGQEKRVIIISTVRSDPTYLEHDFKHKLGFVANAKRFNVAITRAQALMIVIGNPAVLMHDKHWLALLLMCQANRAVLGQMPDLSAAAEAASASSGETGSTQTAGSGQPGNASSSSNNGAYDIYGNRVVRDSVSSSLQQQIVQLERLMASITLDRAVQEVAEQQLMLGALGLSGLVDEAGAGMVRHD